MDNQPSKMLDKHEHTRLAAEADCETFIRVVVPNRILPSVHTEYLKWKTRPKAKKRSLLLLPRDHGKSAVAGALYAAWRITKDPTIRILYISSTSNLATKQLKYIKDILTSDIYRLFWPEMVNFEEAKRTKWSETEIAVDHPKRKAEFIRDPTIFTAGLTTSVTGMHADLIIMDDVVVYENAYTEDGRAKVELLYSLLASVEAADAEQIILGTRYHPDDLYNTIMNKKQVIRDKDGQIIGEEPLYDVFERQVESIGDGSGEFLWPRQKAPNGQEFGFNQEILDQKRALYQGNEIQFYAQYYNNPNMGNADGITRECFQYYDKNSLRRVNDAWFYRDRRLNIFAAMDFAYTTKKRSDYTAIVVVGVDSYNNYYVLDIDRFKTGNISEYYDHMLKLHTKWGFWQLAAETTAAQKTIVEDLKINYIRPNGLGLSIKPYSPQKYEGAKEERIEATLQPKYKNAQMWHYLGGNCQLLEEELLLRKPPHDDIKDCLSTAIIHSRPPTDSRMHNYNRYPLEEMSTTRFGGIH